MARTKSTTPTDAELAILGVLWEHGPSTVREVLQQLNRHRSQESGYTTVLKLMQIMGEKGLVTRDESQRSHVYRAGISEEDVQTVMTRDLMDRAFGGSASKLVMRALSAEGTSAAELDEIRSYLRSISDDRGGES